MSTSGAAPHPAASGEQPAGRDAAPGAHHPAGPTAASPSIASLLERAIAARARLGDQSLPIANCDMLLVTKLLGG